MMPAMLLRVIIGTGACALVAGLALAVWYLFRGTPCPVCHGLGLILTEEDWARAPGFQQPDGPACEACHGTGRVPEKES